MPGDKFAASRVAEPQAGAAQVQDESQQQQADETNSAQLSGLEQRASSEAAGSGPKLKHDKPLKRTRATRDEEARVQAIKRGAAASPSAPPSRKHEDEDEAESNKQALIVVLFLVGLVVCVSSLVSLLLLPSFVGNQIARKLVLKNNSLLLERWSKPNVPMYFKVWLFSVTNAQELASGRATQPQVEEVGPFVFNLRRQKDVISFAGDNLYYTERRTYHFNRALSCCAINTSVTIPNIPLVAVVDRALAYNLPLVGRFVPRLINRAIQSLREPLFVRKQAREILFDGYDVELLRMVSRVGSLIGLPQQDQRFGLLRGRNDTWRPEQDGVWAINTGQRDRKQFGRVSSWNSYKRLPFWPGAQCNAINGSDGTLFPPPIRRSEPLYIFNQELCRTVNLVYDGPSSVRSIQALRFVLNPMNFAHTMQAGSQTPAAIASAAPNLQANTNIKTGGGDIRINPNFQNNVRLVAPLQVAQAAVVPAPAQSASAARVPKPTPVAQHGPGRDLKPSASASEQFGGVRLPPSSAAAAATHPPTLTPTPAARANLLPQDPEQALNQQEKLIRLAQQADERRPESRPNPQSCFCDRKSTHLNGVNVCEFDGLIDLSRCSKQAQVIFGSMPHFHNSDARLLRQVRGLAPNASRHTTYLNIEPNTGLVLGGKRRVQLNVIIKHNNEIDGFENIRDMLVPIVWFEESAEIPEESARKFRSLYTDRVRLVNWTLISLFVGSVVLLAVDARLLLAAHHWRQFKPMSMTSGGGGGGATAPSAPSSTWARELGPAHHRTKRAAALGSPPLVGKLADNWAREQQQSVAPPAASRASRRASLSSPLLKHSSSGSDSASSRASTSSVSSSASTNNLGATTPGDFSDSSSPSCSPPESPGLRKWRVPAAPPLPLGTRAELGKRQHASAAAAAAAATTTRIYLNAAKRAAPEVDNAGRR